MPIVSILAKMKLEKEMEKGPKNVPAPQPQTTPEPPAGYPRID